jgi:glycosyltransferase involved in cell wall biosynthesis
MSPEITVIVPAFNAEKYLRTCLESVTGQTFTSWELIIADDGSTDSTGAIADEYAAKDGRIKVLHLNRHGVSAARNACIDASEGKYLAFVDADDYLEPDYLKELFDRAEVSHADIVQCSFFEDSEGNKTPDANPVDKTYEDPDSMMRAFFAGTHGDIRDSVWAKLFRRDAFADIRFDTGLSIYEDGYYVYQCLRKATKAVCFGKPLYHYVKHGNSATHSGLDEKYKDYFAMFDKLKADFADNGFIRKRIAGREAETALWLMRIMVNNGNKKAAWELRKRAVAAAGDVIRSNAPFALKLKLIGVTIMPHIYFAMLKGRKDQENEKV